MEVYGQTGYAIAEDRNNLKVQLSETSVVERTKLDEQPDPYNDPFAYLAGIIRGTINAPKNDLSSLENNMRVMQILDAAIRSSKTGKTVYLK